MSENCLSPDQLQALLNGGLPPEDEAKLAEHVGECSECRQRLEALAGGVASELKRAPREPEPPSPLLQQVISNLKKDTIRITMAPADPLLAAGSKLRYFGDYEILEELGRGGMGVVYRARQVSLNRFVAIKLILAGQLASDSEVNRFCTEAEAAAMLDHPNIVPIHEIGEHEGRHYFSMKLVEGGSLAAIIARGQRASPVSEAGEKAGEWESEQEQTGVSGSHSPAFSPAHFHDVRGKGTMEIARLVATLSRAVHYAHQRGVLHRDLKPSNILIDREGQPHLTDFGLAKMLERDSGLTHSGAVMGTPNYMAPEMAAGKAKEVTTAVDVFSLGAVLYELLAGRPPFERAEPMATLRAVIEEEAVPPRAVNPEISRDLETICLKCLEKEPARRYPSAEAFAEELDRFCRGEPIAARPVKTPERLWRWCKRKPALASALAGLVSIFVLGFAGVAWKWRGEIHERRLAQQATKHAEQESVRAQQERERAQRGVVRLEIERAEAQFHHGNSDNGLAYLARLLRQQPTNQIVAERLMNALSYRNFCLPIAPLRHEKSISSPQLSRQPEHAKPRISGQDLSITAGSFSPDGRFIVTTSLDGTARLWDSQSGLPVGEPLKHDGGVLWAQFSGDGTKLVTTSKDGAARIWEIQTRQLVATLKHTAVVRHAGFSPDDNKVITASDDGTAQVWDAETGQRSGKPFRHDSPVYFAAFSPDGRRILTAEQRPFEHAPGHIWDAATGAEIVGVPHHFRPEIRNPFPGFSPSDSQVLVFDQNNALLFSSQKGETEKPKAIFPALHHGNSVLALAFSPDGRFVATGSRDATAGIWSTTTGKMRIERIRHKQAVFSVQFDAEGKRLLTGSSDRTARLWDAETGLALIEPVRHESSVLVTRMNTNRMVTLTETDTAWLWDIPSEQPSSKTLREEKGVEYVRFSPDGEILASLNRAGVSLWNVKTGLRLGNLIRPPRDGTEIIDLDFSTDGKLLATALQNGNVLIWDPKNSTSRRPMGRPYQGESTLRRVRFSPDSKRMVVACDDGTAKVWNVGSNQSLCTLRHEARVNYAEFSPDGQHIVTAAWDRTARVWNAQSDNQSTLRLSHDGQVNWARFDPSGTRVVTASRDKTVCIWSARTGVRMWKLTHADALAESHAFDFSANGLSNRLATIAGASLQIWDLHTGQSLVGPIKQSALLLSVRFSPDGKRLVTAADDGTTVVWDANTGHKLSEPLRHEGRFTYAEFSPDGSAVAAGSISTEDAVMIWPVVRAPLPTPVWLPDLAEALAGQRIHETDVSEVVPVMTLFQLRQKLLANSQPDYYSRWARWFLDGGQNKESSGLFSLMAGD